MNRTGLERRTETGIPDQTWLTGGGEMGERIRRFDWSRTPLGPVDRWPQSLRSAVSILLPSKAQIAMFWGPELITLYNDAYRPVLGAKHPQALGLPIREVWNELWPAGLQEMFERVLQTGEAYWAKDRPFFMERHGYAEETFFDVSYDPVRDESGGVGGVFCIVSETTARVLSERRMRTLRELAASGMRARTAEEVALHAAQSLSQDANDLPFLLMYLPAGSGGQIRLAAATGIEAGSPMSPTSVGPADDSPWPLGAAAQTRRPLDVDLNDAPARTPVRTQGGLEVRKAIVLPLCLPNQPRIDGFVVVGVSPQRALDDAYRDFYALIGDHLSANLANVRAYEAERRRAEALAELDRAKTTFFSNISHEFRTPLTLMLGPLEEELQERPQATRLETAHRNSLRLLKLVNQLLDFSRIEAGRISARYEPTDLGAYTSELASLFRSAVEKAGLRFVVSCPSLPEPLHVDRDMWEKIVLNLLSNAFKFTFDGEIAVTLRDLGSQVELAVRDTGIGIAPSDLPRIFDRFHRIEGARGRTHEGTGIGLSLVQELVKLHGGTVDVASVQGQGSTFRIRIPRGSDHLPAEHVMPAAVRHPASETTAAPFLEETIQWLTNEQAGELLEPRGRSQGTAAARDPRPLILLAEDNADMRQYVGRLLAEPYRVVAVSDGAAALAAARTEPPDLLLTDVMMPNVDGFELLRAFRAEARLRSVPIIMLSARSGEDARVEGLDRGADDYLVKPFHARELLARVSTHLRMARLRSDSERVLRGSEERFRLLLTATSDVVYRMNPDWSKIQFIQGRSLFTDTQDSDVPWIERFVPEPDRPLVLRAVEEAIRDKGVFQLEHRILRADGTLGWTFSRAVPLLDEAGRVMEWFGASRDITAGKAAEEALHRRTHTLEIINQTGATLAAGLDLDKLVQAATDAGREVSGAQFGAFFYNEVHEKGEAYTLYTLSGVPREAFAQFPMPRNTAIFDPTFKGQCVIRLGDVLKDPRYGKNAPYHGMPKGHLPVRSYLAVPVLSRSGEVLGGMFYGHAEPDRFTEEAEKIVTAIASQAAIAIDNAQLYQAAQKEIFERTQVEQALRISEARYRNLIHALPVAIYTCDAEGRVTLWNEAAVRLWGRDPVAGSDRWCGSWKCHRPDGSPLPLDASPMAVTLREGRAVRGQEIIMERPDGSRRHVLPHTDPLRGPDGSLAGAVSLLLDITEQKEAEQAMAHLASIVTSSDDAIISKTLQGVVTSWNKGAERVFGYTAEEMIGQPIIRLIPPDRPNEEPSILERLARGESIDHYETVRRRKDGRLIDISLSVSPMRDANGSIMGASKIARDITDRKRAEAALQAAHEELTRRQQELVEANRELESFSYSVSHDLRAPIRTIDAFSRILSEDHGAGLDGEATRCLDIVKKAASQAGELIDDLLEFSRLGRQGLQHEAVDMKAIVQEVVEDLQALQLDRRIEWRVQDLPRAWGDRRLLRIVWNNLLSNALKYTQYRAEAIIEVGYRPDGDRASSIIYFVKDNGVGFDMKYAHKLFGVFQRLHRKEEYEGTGVGLAIVQRIVHRHGGRVWAESAPDAGAAFYFSLGKADQ